MRDKDRKSGVKQSGGPSPEAILPETPVRFIRKIVLEWMTGFMVLASKRPLQQADLFDVEPAFSANRLAEDMTAHLHEVKSAWAKVHPDIELDGTRIPDGLPAVLKAALIRRLFKTFKHQWFIGGFWAACGAGFAIASPMIQQQILTVVTNGDKSSAYGLCVAMFLCQILATICNNTRSKNEVKVAIALRTIMYSTVFRKSLVLSPAAKQEYSTGRIVNLLSTDAGMLEQAGYGIHSIWLIPIQVIIMSGLIIYLLGAGGAVGIAMLVVISALQTFAMRAIFKYDSIAMGHSDARVRKTTEMLSGMKIIKLFAWEDSFISEIKKERSEELRNIFIEINIAAAFYGMIYVIPALVCIVAFSVYSAMGNALTAEIIFPALSLISLLRGPMMEMPEKVQGLIEANVSFGRFATFLASPELQESKLIQNTSKSSENAIISDHASFIWDEWTGIPGADGHAGFIASDAIEIESNEKLPFLKDLTFKIPNGTLCAVVGAVGAGKSSLLQALLGEMKNVSGATNMVGKVAYASQQGWLQNSTLQGNVLFGSEMNKVRYDSVITACALDKDIESFPNGELTEVGERGVQLSGGQVARVNLARSIYSNSDILLLDDPLAAVDSHVSRHIFEFGIRRECAGKTVILVTHQLNLLPNVDMIIYMENGQISEIGSYSNLMQQNRGLAKLVSEYGISSAKSSNSAQVVLTNVSILAEKKEQFEIEDVPALAPKTVMMEEERVEGAVTLYHYKTYIGLSGGAWMWILISVLGISINLARVIGDYWLIWWSDDAFNQSNAWYIGIYAGLGLSQSFLTVLLAMTVARVGITGARSLHENALVNIGRAPMSFFDTNPLGRIVNRFSRDVAECDRWLVMNLRGVLTIGTNILCMLGLIAYAVPTILIVVAIVIPIYYYVQRFYRNASRELKRLENLSRSPFFANCAESFNGLATIRAFKASKSFIAVNESLIDEVNKPTILRYFVSIWVSIRAETFVAFICLAVSLMGVGFNISTYLLGLSIGYTLNLAFTINILMHIMSEGEGRMNSVERLDHYHKNIPSEAPMDLPPPYDNWPENGAITFKHAEMRYRPDLPPVLRNLKVEIKSNEKIGIVGRTGAGKSSIISALYRLVELSAGSIEIDGVDISTVGLRKLRTSLSIIPQAPLLFQGTIRSNVDPLSNYSDSEVWTVLEHASLKEYVASLDEKLEAPVQENGENLSVGQRQLLCLARAMLIKPKILLIDEATASVDIKTDTAIQIALRSSFSNCTILCVAHRLLTIIDYDRVLVLKDGQAMEFNTPDELLKNPDSLFTDLVNETGPEMAALLKNMAGKRFGELNIEQVVEESLRV
ncbi:Multidrug resistance-associated protein 1 [Physocladia obscura]|uniref:Multidrug resistance-associated protein 1 n=1 Tax=Physocladia obscura TaxID=109957 RepID=A0AAD5SZY8_9FUNG|nr:Multidrug resistance-associated protein 1 [Physocladia obscura]KAJ3119288.1 Multidrug resistance-associated protein 1 [Physocladia obscura]